MGESQGMAHPLLILFLELLLVLGYEKATKCAGVGEILQGEEEVAVSKKVAMVAERPDLAKEGMKVLLIGGPVCPRNAGRCCSWRGGQEQDRVQTWSRTATSIQWCKGARTRGYATGGGVLDYVQGFSAEEILCCALLFRGEG